MTTWKEIRDKTLADDPDARAEYERLAPRYRVIKAVVAERTKRGWSQADLAAAAGMNRAAIGRLEAGLADPRLETVATICRALDLPLTIGTEPIVSGRKRRAS